MSEGNLKVTFHIPILTLIPKDVGSNYTNLSILQTELDSNTMSVHSSQNSKGHLVLAQPTLAYIISDPGLSFPTHTNIGLTPVHSRGASTEEISEKPAASPPRQDHTNYQTCERCLKTSLLDYIPKIFLEEQKDDTLGLGDKTTLVFLTHL